MLLDTSPQNKILDLGKINISILYLGSSNQHLQGNPSKFYKDPFIQVRLSVQNKICDSLSPPYNASYFLDYVPKGSTLFEVMVLAKPLGFT